MTCWYKSTKEEIEDPAPGGFDVRSLAAPIPRHITDVRCIRLQAGRNLPVSNTMSIFCVSTVKPGYNVWNRNSETIQLLSLETSVSFSFDYASLSSNYKDRIRLALIADRQPPADVSTTQPTYSDIYSTPDYNGGFDTCYCGMNPNNRARFHQIWERTLSRYGYNSNTPPNNQMLQNATGESCAPGFKTRINLHGIVCNFNLVNQQITSSDMCLWLMWIGYHSAAFDNSSLLDWDTVLYFRSI